MYHIYCKSLLQLLSISILSNKYFYSFYFLFWFYFSHKCLWSAFKERYLPIKVAIFTSSFSSKILCFATRQNQKNAMEIGYEGAQLTKQGSSYVQTNPGLFVQPNDFQNFSWFLKKSRNLFYHVTHLGNGKKGLLSA